VSAIRYENQGAIAWITLNRPKNHNTLTLESRVELAAAWDEVRRDESVLVVILTGAGEVDFCCGADLGSFIPMTTGDLQHTTEDAAALSDEVTSRAFLIDEPLCKPVIGAINGRALGGGTELLQCTDIRIAVETATFALPEPRVGLAPGAGSLVRLARQIPYAHAMYMLLTCEAISAQTALNWGLISEVVSSDRLKDRAEELAHRVASNAPLAMRAIKKTVHETHTLGWEKAFAIEKRSGRMVSESSDAKEGPKAFMEKRRPMFSGS
jgi:enoyl-CoA hydratase